MSSILSAMMANAVTLALVILAYPLLATLHLGFDTRTLLISVSVVVATSTAVLFLRKKLFSACRAADLHFVARMHLVRIFLTTGLAALCWHLALPGVALQWWLLLATLRMLLSRLPLLPNKDIVFAGLAVFLIGHDAEIGALMTMMASLILVHPFVHGPGAGRRRSRRDQQAMKRWLGAGRGPAGQRGRGFRWRSAVGSRIRHAVARSRQGQRPLPAKRTRPCRTDRSHRPQGPRRPAARRTLPRQ